MHREMEELWPYCMTYPTGEALGESVGEDCVFCVKREAQG